MMFFTSSQIPPLPSKVVVTATSWYGYHFRTFAHELGHCEFYLPFPSDEWQQQVLSLQKFSLLNVSSPPFITPPMPS
jgi:hypothetical protein